MLSSRTDWTATAEKQRRNPLCKATAVTTSCIFAATEKLKEPFSGKILISGYALGALGINRFFLDHPEGPYLRENGSSRFLFEATLFLLVFFSAIIPFSLILQIVGVYTQTIIKVFLNLADKPYYRFFAGGSLHAGETVMRRSRKI